METAREAQELHPHLPASVEVIDCTLRDGEQAPGVWFTTQEKLDLATALSDAGVSALDAGFPASSGSELEAMQAMHDLGLSASIAATARPLPQDVAAAVKAYADEVFLFMPTSDLRLKETLGITRDQAAAVFRSGAEAAAAGGLGVNLVFEDATRTDPRQLIDTAVELRRHVPVRRLVLADTTGCAHPATMQQLIHRVDHALDHEITLCTHNHNDFGLATANTLAAVSAGARAITCTVNGLGERAGNADLAECVAALTHLYGVEHGVDPLALPALSADVERASGVATSPIKPVTGFNVFRHESGVHVDGMLKDNRSYEFLPAAWTGRRSEYVLGKHSGTSLVRHLFASAGLRCDDALVARALGEVRDAVERRDKAAHGQAHTDVRATYRRLLSGYDPARLIERYRDQPSTDRQVER
ncbi:LeuA family protein [Streptomyces sp. NPDC001922]|uniref:LeuA family protein n=1 Tax=Streptomyces sp. NPDC001922 TaxID=3364624 RepID=UPI0036A50951